METHFTIILSEAELAFIVNCLGQQPFNQVSGLISGIISQVNDQKLRQDPAATKE